MVMNKNCFGVVWIEVCVKIFWVCSSLRVWIWMVWGVRWRFLVRMKLVIWGCWIGWWVVVDGEEGMMVVGLIWGENVFG